MFFVLVDLFIVFVGSVHEHVVPGQAEKPVVHGGFA